MSTGGLVLIVAGVWVLAQVFAGGALGRLGIAGDATTPGKASSTPPSSGGGAQPPGGGGGGGSW